MNDWSPVLRTYTRVVGIGYRYFGIVFGRLRLSMSLDRVENERPDSHAAVWLGVNSPKNRHWVQAGIEQSGGDDRPYLYVEIGVNGRQAWFERWPWEAGRRVTVRLIRHPSGTWQAAVGVHRSHGVYIPKRIATIDGMLEAYGVVSAVAHVGIKRVTTGLTGEGVKSYGRIRSATSVEGGERMGITPNEPPLDQQEGSTAAQEAAQARQDIEGQLTDGSLALEDLFQMSTAEPTTSPHRVVGHMHLKAALLALKGIGEVKAEEILEETGLEGDRHIDTIGTNEQQALIEAVQEKQPGT